MRRMLPWSLLFLGIVVSAGCGGSVPKPEFVSEAGVLQLRELSTRQFEGVSESDLLSAATGVLQDLKFTIEEIETGLGLITGTNFVEKKGGHWYVDTPWKKDADGDKEFRASVVIRRVTNTEVETYNVRVTFQVTDFINDRPFLHRNVYEPEVYNEFFGLLSKSIFLEGQDI